MPISITKLRNNIYQILDQVLKTGIPVELERKGQRLLILSAEKKKKLDNLVQRFDVIEGDAEDIVHLDWSGEWNRDLS